MVKKVVKKARSKAKSLKRSAEESAATDNVKSAPKAVVDSEDEGDESPDEGERVDMKLSKEVEEKIKGSVAEKRKNKRSKGKANKGPTDPGVIYLGHIPYGFFEKQMKGYFTQFGDITRMRLSRSKKTGRSRGYAFIEFAEREVAEIVAETMHNYLMFDRMLKCEMVAKDKVHSKMFKANKRVPHRALERAHHNRERTDEEQEKRVEKLLKKDQKKRAKFEKLGIKYTFDGYKAEA